MFHSYFNEYAFDGENVLEEIAVILRDCLFDPYLENGVFEKINNTFVYVEREVTGGKVRKGIVGLIDLENFKINFGGFRDYLHYLFDFIEGNEKKAQILNVYLTDEADLVNFNITVGDGDITLSHIQTECDYKIVLANGVVRRIPPRR